MLRLFHPIPKTLDELKKGPLNCSKHNVLLVEALKKELGWSDAQIWRQLVFNNTTTTNGAVLNHSKAQQRRVLAEASVDDVFHLPYRVIKPSEASIDHAKVEVLNEFERRYGFKAKAIRVKAPDGASGDEQYSSRIHSSREIMDRIRERLYGPLPKRLRLKRLAARFMERVQDHLKHETLEGDYLVVPELDHFADISVNGIVIDNDDLAAQGLKRGYHLLGITRQCQRLTTEGSSWCGNMQLLEGMTIRPADQHRGVPALVATPEFIERVVRLVTSYMQLQYKLHQLTGMSSVDLGVFYNPRIGDWEIVIFEVNPRLTNGTTLCELLWQVDQALRERGIPVPSQFTGALMIMKVNKDKPLTYQQQVDVLGKDFLAANYPELGAMPIVPNSWEQEGQIVYSFFAANPIELHRQIERVWLKLDAIGAPDSIAILESIEAA